MNKNNQRGGWYETTFDSFKELVIQKNDKLKQTDQWWNFLKDDLNFKAVNMSDEFFADERFEGMPMDQVIDKLDLINILLIDISFYISKAKKQQRRLLEFIEHVNDYTIRLRNTDNIDFVEFIQMLVKHAKSTEYYSEINQYNMRESISISWNYDRLADKIISLVDYNYYKIYNEAFFNCVQLLEIFLHESYTGRYGELQDININCNKYFYNITIIPQEDIFGKSLNISENIQKLREIEKKKTELQKKYQTLGREESDQRDTRSFQDEINQMHS